MCPIYGCSEILLYYFAMVMKSFLFYPILLGMEDSMAHWPLVAFQLDQSWYNLQMLNEQPFHT